MANRIAEAGIFALPVDAYHLDPSVTPSMSASNAETMLAESARHVWQQHPRLNPEAADDFDREKMASDKRLKMEHGSALHTLILGAGRPILTIEGDAYRSAKAKQQRDDATFEGAIPILEVHKPKLLAVARAVAEQVKEHRELAKVFGAPGRAEQTMLWDEPIGRAARGKKAQTIRCRALVDWLPDDPGTPMVDFKFTAMSTAPLAFERTVREGIALRSAHYLRGAQRLRGRAPRGYWIVAVELDAPHALTVFNADEALIHHAREQWAEAAARWHTCLTRGTDREHWPFWKPAVHLVAPTDYQVRQWEDRKLMDGIRPARNGEISLARTRALMATLGGPVQ